MQQNRLAFEPGHAETTWDAAQPPLVLAVDIGSSSVRALMFDAHGLQIDTSEHQIPHRLHTTADGGAEADPHDLFQLVIECIDQVLDLAGEHASDIGAVATTSFWHSLMGVDAAGSPTSPVYMWGDKRSGDEVPRLRESLDARQLHRETGCRFHSSYWPAKLLWLRQERPAIVADTRTWCSFADYVDRRLHRCMQTSVSMASGTGLLDVEASSWHCELLEVLDLDEDRLPALVDRDEPLPLLTGAWQSRWPALAEVPWFPAIGDGAAANLGTGAVGKDRVAITIGTSGAMRIITEDATTPTMELSARIWSYRLDRSHRVTGGALSNGGNVTGWLARYLAGGNFDILTAEANRMAPDSHGLTVLPLFAGERSPSWNDDASGVFAGLTLATRPGHLYRAVLEGTAYRFASIHEALLPMLEQDHEIYVNGAAALKSPLWLQIVADTLGRPLSALDAEAEGSARGVAVSALEAIGAVPSLRPESPAVAATYTPVAEATPVYRAGQERQAALEQAILNFWAPT
ncbi:MAG TPA: gluconokinase [Thermomicrobiales bacterium]|nr:gluconokinase [Thermomicrobiales bacterium]